jgi:Zn-dependent protease
MNWSLPVCRVFGVEIRLHWSWVILLAIITVGLGESLAVSVKSSANVTLGWVAAGGASLLILVSVVAHELAHVRAGRGTGPAPSVVVVQLLGGTYVMDARPQSPGQELRLAAAGPLVNMLFVLAFGGLAVGLDFAAGSDESLLLLSVAALVPAAFNLFMALVSIIPGYPLDGARVVHAIAWARSGRPEAATRTAVRVGRISGYAIMLVGLVLAALLLVAGLAMVLAGWLLVGSSRLLERRLVVEELVAGATVADAIVADVDRLPGQLTLDVFADEFMAGQTAGAALVERGQEPVGIIGLSQIRRIPRRRWETTHAEDAMVALAAVPRVAPDAPLWPALEILERSGLDALAVEGKGDMQLITRISVSRVVKERVEDQMRQERTVSRLRKALGTDEPGKGPSSDGDDRDDEDGSEETDR